jgi:multicomponent Na+:H+ antiporter subunit E
VRVALLAGLWWILTGGELRSWIFGVPAVAAAAYLSLKLAPAGGGWRWTAGGVARFVPFFLWQSLSGGVDVAWRAFRPDMPLEPDLIEYEWRLAHAPARVFMAGTVSLLPGTLSAELGDRVLRVHTLVRGPRASEGLERLEERVAALFGVEMVESGGSQ